MTVITTIEDLRVPALFEGGDRQHLGRRHHALAAAAVNADLQHQWITSRVKGGT